MGAIAMTEPARPWPERGLNSLIPAAKRRIGTLGPVPGPPLEPLPVPVAPVPGAHHMATATLAASPHMRYLFDGSPTRPATAVEAARNARRRTNPYDEFAWLYRLDAELNGRPTLGATDSALAPGVGSGSDEGAIGYG